MSLAVSYNGERNVFLCEKSRHNTTNGMKVKFADWLEHGNRLRYIE